MVIGWLAISFILWLHQKCNKYKIIINVNVHTSLPKNSHVCGMHASGISGDFLRPTGGSDPENFHVTASDLDPEHFPSWVS